MALQHVDSEAFWKKVRATAGMIPFANEIVAMWYAAWDPRTPVKVKAIVLGAVAYFILPFDIVPDVIAGLGYGDDLAVLVGAFRAVRPHVTDEHRARAREALKAET